MLIATKHVVVTPRAGGGGDTARNSGGEQGGHRLAAAAVASAAWGILLQLPTTLQVLGSKNVGLQSRMYTSFSKHTYHQLPRHMWLRLNSLHYFICGTPQPELHHFNTKDAVNSRPPYYEEQTIPRQSFRYICVFYPLYMDHLSRQFLMLGWTRDSRLCYSSAPSSASACILMPQRNSDLLSSCQHSYDTPLEITQALLSKPRRRYALAGQPDGLAMVHDGALAVVGAAQRVWVPRALC